MCRAETRWRWKPNQTRKTRPIRRNSKRRTASHRRKNRHAEKETAENTPDAKRIENEPPSHHSVSRTRLNIAARTTLWAFPGNLTQTDCPLHKKDQRWAKTCWAARLPQEEWRPKQHCETEEGACKASWRECDCKHPRTHTCVQHKNTYRRSTEMRTIET